MTDNLTTADSYAGEHTEFVRSTCLYVATKLGEIMEELVVIGGLVPSLLIGHEDLPAGAEPHVGTMDLDLAGCVKTPTSGHERPFRHSRESGNPGVLEGPLRGVSPLHPAWIPAFAGMTFSGAVASLGWGFDTAC